MFVEGKHSRWRASGAALRVLQVMLWLYGRSNVFIYNSLPYGRRVFSVCQIYEKYHCLRYVFATKGVFSKKIIIFVIAKKVFSTI